MGIFKRKNEWYFDGANIYKLKTTIRLFLIYNLIESN
jgi:hypothetical protein